MLFKCWLNEQEADKVKKLHDKSLTIAADMDDEAAQRLLPYQAKRLNLPGLPGLPHIEPTKDAGKQAEEDKKKEEEKKKKEEEKKKAEEQKKLEAEQKEEAAKNDPTVQAKRWLSGLGNYLQQAMQCKTLAGQNQKLPATIREHYVDMFDKHEVSLKELRDQIEILQSGDKDRLKTELARATTAAEAIKRDIKAFGLLQKGYKEKAAE